MNSSGEEMKEARGRCRKGRIQDQVGPLDLEKGRLRKGVLDYLNQFHITVRRLHQLCRGDGKWDYV